MKTSMIIVIVVVAVIGFIFVLALIGSTMLPASSNSLNSGTPTSSPVPSASPMPSKNIDISYSEVITQNITWFYSNGYSYDQQADSGKVFVEVKMTIKNNGYDSISTNPLNFYLIADSIKYNVDSNTYTLNDWDTVDVLSGGTFQGTLVFQVPLSDSPHIIGYEALFKTYNIDWTKT